MSPLTHTLLTTLALAMGLMTLVWVAASIKRDASIVDPVWGFGFVLVASVACWLHAPPTPRMWLLVGMTGAWGLRLSLFLLWRNWGAPEDRRDAAMRRKHGTRFVGVSLWTVFLLQALLVWFVSLPIQGAAVQRASGPLGILDVVGVTIWTVGLVFETVGDWQLARFQANPRSAGRVLDRGLWHYTRHPNYFGDFCVWWGLYIVAAAGSAGWTVASPILMSVLLMKVSGVALLEGTIGERRPEYAAYQARTNAFFPGLPKPRGEQRGPAEP